MFALESCCQLKQQGKDRADYGAQLLKSFSKVLTEEFGKGFSVPALYHYRSFYLTFPEILSTPWRILTWSHYKRLLSVSDADARAWYLKEAAEQMWGYKALLVVLIILWQGVVFKGYLFVNLHINRKTNGRNTVHKIGKHRRRRPDRIQVLH